MNPRNGRRRWTVLAAAGAFPAAVTTGAARTVPTLRPLATAAFGSGQVCGAR